MALLDIFDDDAFSVHNLTLAVDKLPYVPGRIGRLNLFQQSPITTNVAIIEERHGTLSLLPTMPRGSSDQTTQGRVARKLRAFPVPHVPNWDQVLAADLEGKRSFGSETQLEMFSTVLNDRLQRMKDNHEVTKEYHRIGALHGNVLDADGSTSIINWFTEFGISQTEVEFNFYDPGSYDQAEPVIDVKTKATAIKRFIQDALGATPFSGITAFCGDAFFDDLVHHATVRKAYEQYQDNAFRRTDDQTAEGGFQFAGITWENYRGSVGSVDFFDADEAVFFPTGVRDVFTEVLAPADFIETVNTRGQALYAKQERMKWDKGIELHTQHNTLYMCTRPACLIKGNRLNEAPGT